MDGPIPRPGGGCAVWLFVLVAFAGILLGVCWPAPELDMPKKLCECSSNECPYTDNHIPREDMTNAEMHYWSIE